MMKKMWDVRQKMIQQVVNSWYIVWWKSFPTDVVIFDCKRNPLSITGTNIVISRYNQRKTICIICWIQNNLSKHDTAIKYGLDYSFSDIWYYVFRILTFYFDNCIWSVLIIIFVKNFSSTQNLCDIGKIKHFVY